MSKAYLNLLHFIKAEGYTYWVKDGGESIYTDSYEEAKGCIEAVEEAWVAAINNGNDIGRAYIILPGPGAVDDDESVADWTVTPFMDKWEQHFFGE